MEMTCYCGYTAAQKPDCDCEIKARMPNAKRIYIIPFTLAAQLPPSIERETRRVAVKFGYTFGRLTDGTILLEPPPDPDCCGMCASNAQEEPETVRVEEPQSLLGAVWNLVKSVLERKRK